MAQETASARSYGPLLSPQSWSSGGMVHTQVTIGCASDRNTRVIGPPEVLSTGFPDGGEDAEGRN